MTVPALDLADDPTERGRQQGEALRADIENNIAVYLDVFTRLGLRTDELLEQALCWLPHLRRQNTEFSAEVEGIAEGAGRPLAEAVMLNVRYELIIGMMARHGREPTGVDGCTSFGLLAHRSETGGPVLGQNWDWVPGARTYVARVRRNGRPDFIGHAEAGTAAATQQGVNEHGIGVVINALMATADSRYRYQRPFRLRVRDILSATTLGDAIKAVTASFRTVSMNFMIGHHLDEIVDVEAGPDTAACLLPTDGILTHANHFAQLAIDTDVMRAWPTTVFRGPRLDRLLRRNTTLDRKHIHECLADPLLCARADPDSPGDTATLTAILIDLERRAIAVTAGPPDAHEFEEHLL
ncbi:C45 family peptidase [Saccharomonospora sp. NPDC046836]|uniref:C45 family peptidase n=1 Tax=Saccharomonospora sp. NPDC046836 TaxID=3156921 RepID=UPI00340E80CE